MGSVQETDGRSALDPIRDTAAMIGRDQEALGFVQAFDPRGDSMHGHQFAGIAELLDGCVWLIGDGAIPVADSVREQLAVGVQAVDLQRRANELAPRFVAEHGRIEIVADDPWIQFREHDGRRVALGDLGAGIARWASIAIEAAARGPTNRDAFRLWLLDEPEAHLHLNAVRDLGDWLLDRNSEGIGIVVATHALELLDMPTEHADTLLLKRLPGSGTRAESASDLLFALTAAASDLGIRPSDALRLARGVLIVEGPHDRQVIRHFYGTDLAKNRALLLPLHGTHETLALVELEYLSQLGLPIAYLCDNVRQHLLAKPQLPADATEEEQKVFLFFSYSAADPGIDISVHSHGLPDILFALPDDATRKVVGSRFPGWRAVGEYRGKQVLANELGVQNVGSRFIQRVLDESHADARPSPALERAMAQIFATLFAS